MSRFTNVMLIEEYNENKNKKGGVKMAKCLQFKTVYSPALGKKVRRCARFGGYGQLRKGAKCVRWKMVTTKTGRRVRRCADFEGEYGQGPKGQKCVRYKNVYSRKLGKNVRRCAEFE